MCRTIPSDIIEQHICTTALRYIDREIPNALKRQGFLDIKKVEPYNKMSINSSFILSDKNSNILTMHRFIENNK